ncbi:Lipoprotein-releasing system ATP-binding protein LolD [subsurface metagenome]
MMILEMISLLKVYRTGAEDLTVLKGINFSIEEGTTAGISGESGSGKSTLLNLIGGLDSITSGQILFRGSPIQDRDESELTEYRSRQVGFIFQFHYLLKDFTALENILMPAYILGTPLSTARLRADALLKRVGLGARRDHYPVQLSGGERQRVAVARALMNDPELILADEPTGNLDEKNSIQVKNLLYELVKEDGKTMILVSHDPELAGSGDRHYHLENGILTSI